MTKYFATHFTNRFKLATCIVCFAFFLFCITTFNYAQRNYLFEDISVPEGLSNSVVNNFFQDSNGFLWVSTADGLNRYDGNNFKVFRNNPNDSTTIPNNSCYAITEDTDGFIWVGVDDNMIAKYNPKNETFQKYVIDARGITNYSIFYTALYDTKGNLWFASNYHGIQKFNKAKNKFEQVGLDVSNKNTQWGNIYSIIELKNGNIIAADYVNGIKIYNEKLNLFQPYYLNENYSPNGIYAAYKDKAGNIWFGGGIKQLIKYSPSYHTIDYYNPLTIIKNRTNHDMITGITQDVDGFIWIGIYDQGLYKIDPDTKDIKEYNFSELGLNNSNRYVISNIYKDKYGVIWISFWSGGIVKFDPLQEPFTFNKFNNIDGEVSNTNFSTVISGIPKSKEITVGTFQNGLFTYNLENHQFNKLEFKLENSSITDGRINIQGLADDNEGNKWFAYNNLGLHTINKNNKLTIYKSPYKNKTTAYFVKSIKTDLSGNIWIASRCGFEKYNPIQNRFTLLPTIMNKTMSSNLNSRIHKIADSQEPISSLLKVGEASNLEKTFSLNHDQKVLIICIGEGTLSNGLYFGDAGSLLNGDGKLIWSMNNLFSTFNDGGGFKNRIALGCLNLKSGHYKITYATDVGHSYGHWNVIPPPDSMWYGIQVLSLSDSDYKIINELNEKEINSSKFMPMEVGTSIEFSKKYNNVLWLGSDLNGFFKYDLSTGDFRQYNFNSKNANSSENSIRDILEDSEGILWVTNGNSLLRFNPDTEKIETLNKKDGLPSNQINSLVEDNQGNLWLNTSAGLSKLNKNAPRDKLNFVNFDIRDGLPGFSNSTASWINKDGEIFLGCNDGIVSFYPGKINETKPDVVVEDIKVSDISLKSDSSFIKLEKSVMKINELDLSYQQNNVSFEFASIHFSRPKKNKIMYMLEGFNNRWKSTDRNFVSFTNLSPGDYTLRLKGSNGDGIWNDKERAIKIIISPPWWKTWWAYSIYFFGFFGILGGVRKFELERRKEKENNKLLQLENERKTKELEEARQLQLSMLPKTIPTLPHLDIAVYMKTATEVGGDYYDFNVGFDGTLTVAIGDATGHGMKAGTIVSMAKALFASNGSKLDMKTYFNQSSDALKEIELGRLMMAFMMIKINNNKFEICNAGMPPLFIFRKHSNEVEEIMLKGMPLGAMKNFPYEIRETEISSGDTLLLLSDGFPELKNETGEQYNYSRVNKSFESVAEKQPLDIIDYLKEEGSNWLNGREPDDDVTFVVIKAK